MYNSLITKYSPDYLLEDEKLSKHTSFKIGGPADIFLMPDSLLLLQDMIKEVSRLNLKSMVIGGGNNLLFADSGFRGVIISTEKLNRLSLEGNTITAQCGVSLKELTAFALENSLSGLEFACGIPGSVGGAVFMNAGAYGGEMKDVIISVDYLDHDDVIRNHALTGHNFDYRTSIYQQRNYLVLETRLKLTPSYKDQIQARMDDLQARRQAKQPLEYPSAGSVFRRPEGHFVGKLIDDCGLRGYSIGGAQISEKHSGFIINKGNATADDVIKLISYIQESVKCKFQVALHTEVRIIDP